MSLDTRAPARRAAAARIRRGSLAVLARHRAAIAALLCYTSNLYLLRHPPGETGAQSTKGPYGAGTTGAGKSRV